MITKTQLWKRNQSLTSIIETFYPDPADLTPTRESEICKVFTKKLSTKDAFGLKFAQMTRDALKGKKKDTILGMYMQLSDHLAASRQIVNNAQDLGSNDSRRHSRQPPSTGSASLRTRSLRLRKANQLRNLNRSTRNTQE